MNDQQTFESHQRISTNDAQGRVFVIFWDKDTEKYLAVDVPFLIHHGVPFNPKTNDELEYITTQLGH